jgi:hypothetical protein
MYSTVYLSSLCFEIFSQLENAFPCRGSLAKTKPDIKSEEKIKDLILITFTTNAPSEWLLVNYGHYK